MTEDGTDFWGGEERCWACRVVANQSPGSVVSESGEVAVLVNPFPLSPGHALIVPRIHIKDLYALPDDLAGPILSTAARIARAAKRAVRADGITLRQNNEAASDQHLFHFHLHVIPRFTGDGERFARQPELISLAEQEAIAVRLREVLSEGR
jgi:histidine triad (HIT) family protein